MNFGMLQSYDRSFQIAVTGTDLIFDDAEPVVWYVLFTD